MIVLGLDTSGSTASAAVWAHGRSVAVEVAAQPRAHGALVTVLQERALAAAGMVIADVDALAVATGPGLFTGLRVGVVAVHVLSWARDLPATGVGTLRAIARRVSQEHHPVGPFVVAIDARRREVFWQRFGADGRPIGDASVATVADVVHAAHPGPPALVFGDVGSQRLGLPGVLVDTRGLAAEVAAVGAGALAAKAPQPVTPLYLRRPDVTPAGPAKSVLGSAAEP